MVAPRDPVVRSIKIIRLLRGGKKHRKDIIDALGVSPGTFDKLKLKLIAIGEIRKLGGGYFALSEWNEMDDVLTPAFEKVEKAIPQHSKEIGAFPVPYYKKICYQARLNPDDNAVRTSFLAILKKHGYYLYDKR